MGFAYLKGPDVKLSKIKTKIKEIYEDKRNIVEVFGPLIAVNVVIVAALVYVNRKFVTWENVDIDSDLLKAVYEDRATLCYWLDENGNEKFKLINEDGTFYIPGKE